MQKTITFGIPCYNSAEYMDHCIESILEGSAYADDVHIVIVDDGSDKDDTLAKARQWHWRYPTIVDVVHQENGGHGMAVLAGLEAAKGVYYKVVDSDDWLDATALRRLLATLRVFINRGEQVDLVVTNYVYEHAADKVSRVVHYRGALPRNRVVGWEQTKHFAIWQNILMHSLTHRTDVLRSVDMPMPAHTFYVDNIYAYVPLPMCEKLYYLDVDLYRYFIGREDQSVNEKNMVARIDQQIRITRIMMESYHLFDDVTPKKLRTYMQGYFTMMMAICSILSRMSDKEDAMAELEALWSDLKAYDERMYVAARRGLVGVATNPRGPFGEKIARFIYRGARKVCKFN